MKVGKQMNILLIFQGFIVAFIIVLYYKNKIRNLPGNQITKVHFMLPEIRMIGYGFILVYQLGALIYLVAL